MSDEKLYRNEEWLRKQIRDECLSFYEVSDKAGVAESCIRKWADKYNIKRPMRDEELLRHFAEKYDTFEEIADALNTRPYKARIALEQKDIINTDSYATD